MSLRHTTSERVCAIRERTLEYRGRTHKRIICFLTTACALLFTALVGVFLSTEHGLTVAVYGICSSVMLHGSAGIYVVIGIMTFLAGSVSVVAAVKLRKKDDKHSLWEDKK